MDLGYNALVTDADQRVALEITRSLGKSGLSVLLVEKSENNHSPLAAASKYCRNFVTVPNYASGEFLTLCEQCEVVYPVSTNTIIGCYQKAIPTYPKKFLLPEKCDLFRDINDKNALSRLAHEAGVKYPKSILLTENSRLKESARKIGYPLVLKLSNDEGLFLSPAERYRIIESESNISAAYESLKKHGKDILMQQYIDGVGVGFSAIYSKSNECVASFQHQRLREYPVTGGPSTYCESVRHEELAEQGQMLLNSLKWVGPAMVEFKYNPKTGEAVILEVNPRYWGSLPLARKSAINIPLLHYKILANESTSISYSAKQYKVGIKLKFFITDFLAAIKEVKLKKNYLTGSFKYISEFFDPCLYWGLWDISDIRPSLRYVFNHIFKR